MAIKDICRVNFNYMVMTTYTLRESFNLGFMGRWILDFDQLQCRFVP